jgi:hypothetical protein
LFSFIFSSPREFPKERLPETLVLLDNFDNLVRKLNLKLNQVELVCRLVKCLITTIVLQKKGIDLQEESEVLEKESNPHESLSTSFKLEDIPNEMSLLLKHQFKFVLDSMSSKLPYPLENISSRLWDQELQVSEENIKKYVRL